MRINVRDWVWNGNITAAPTAQEGPYQNGPPARAVTQSDALQPALLLHLTSRCTTTSDAMGIPRYSCVPLHVNLYPADTSPELTMLLPGPFKPSHHYHNPFCVSMYQSNRTRPYQTIPDHTRTYAYYAYRYLPYGVSYFHPSFRFFFSSLLLLFYTRLEREHSSLLFSPPSPSLPFFPSLLLLFSFRLGEIRDWSTGREQSAAISVDFVFSPLHQLSGRAVSVSACFDVLPIRRLLAQTASSLFP